MQKKDSSYKWGSNVWSIWGGHIKKDEELKNAIKRELKEETGLNFKNIEFLEKYNYEGNLNNFQVKILHNIFLIKFNGDLSKIKLGEGAGFGLFEKEEIKNLKLMEPSEKILEKFWEK